MIFVDAHVHIYDCFGLDLLLDSALENFRIVAERYGSGESGPVSFLLLLAETADCSWFQRQYAQAKNAGCRGVDAGNQWTLFHTGDALSLTAYRNGLSGETIHLVAGRQIVTAEKIEILALFCNTCLPDGLGLDETIARIQQCQGVPVLPWGVGKWFGQRGKILSDLMTVYEGQGLFLGDNGGRPVFWPWPTLFQLARKKGLSILPGSDSLVFPHELKRIGSFGFFAAGHTFDPVSPAASLKELLIIDQEAVSPYGQLQNSRRFFMNQLQLRFHS